MSCTNPECVCTHYGLSDSTITLFDTPASATAQRRDQPNAKAIKKYATKTTQKFFLIAVQAVKRFTLANGIRDHTALA